MQFTPADKTSTVDQDAGATQGADAGTCITTQTGCTYTATCDSQSDAGAFRESETVMINSDGTISGSVMISYDFSIAGAMTTVSCTFDLTATKQ